MTWNEVPQTISGKYQAIFETDTLPLSKLWEYFIKLGASILGWRIRTRKKKVEYQMITNRKNDVMMQVLYRKYVKMVFDPECEQQANTIRDTISRVGTNCW